jgi:hypothetical protein
MQREQLVRVCSIVIIHILTFVAFVSWLGKAGHEVGLNPPITQCS